MADDLRLDPAVAAAAGSPSLTARDLKLLCLLLDHGRLTTSELAGLVGIKLPRASRNANRLVGAGYAARLPGIHDLRHVHFMLTPAGRHLIDAVREAQEAKP